MKFFRFRSIKHLLFTVFLIFLVSIFVYYTTIVVIARKNTPTIISRALNSEKIVLELNDLSKEQIDILLKVEDPNFYNHKGIDFKTPGAGITTITQGLVKKFYFENFRPGIAKIKQTLIARFALNPLVSKDDQLKLFINYVYLGKLDGNPIYGFANASERYFGKPFSQLSEEEYISLVAMIIAPNKFNVIKNPEANSNRVERIKLLIRGEYVPKGLMDLYYGGKYFSKKPRSFFNKLIWGY
ncbi:biosynthetic peptidoglycan transglycosylase [Caloranaerobacter sp. TR13]|uniref:biosynthetic peptidoglycan transglycosylase n=1 Tax=Caloranaerobacter sp. TR13 TaxID=1302151 RepID=UPI0006D41A94|nr:biosynthetic peptidoglycan transglycosylase [Caloranaerobacter sp. TR13]